MATSRGEGLKIWSNKGFLETYLWHFATLALNTCHCCLTVLRPARLSTLLFTAGKFTRTWTWESTDMTTLQHMGDLGEWGASHASRQNSQLSPLYSFTALILRLVCQVASTCERRLFGEKREGELPSNQKQTHYPPNIQRVNLFQPLQFELHAWVVWSVLGHHHSSSCGFFTEKG